MNDKVSEATQQIADSWRPELYLGAFRSFLSSVNLEKELMYPERSVLLLNLGSLAELALKAKDIRSLESMREMLSLKIAAWLASRPKPSTLEVKIVEGRSHLQLRVITKVDSTSTATIIQHSARSNSFPYTEEASKMLVDRIAQSLIDFARADDQRRRELVFKTTTNTLLINKTPTPYQQRIGRLEV